MVAAKLFNSKFLVSLSGYLAIISGIMAGREEHSLCPQSAGKDWLFSITCPSFCGKDAMKNPSQNVSLSSSFFFSVFLLNKYCS